ncbi:hypothetical protein SCLCIDRAFT_203590 [Scleroderma citrinum Foug A]|uniref:Uncharacterized protein n=1 Tax=Scleroderma citrinum Foug A TaxID=1036808 RepID=A0A0C2ZWA4_9AGAM|nr:hypothetical protein SCLCIDRAFT_203590 [Scleroderma citrinum Foug A]
MLCARSKMTVRLRHYPTFWPGITDYPGLLFIMASITLEYGLGVVEPSWKAPSTNASNSVCRKDTQPRTMWRVSRKATMGTRPLARPTY